MKTEIDLVADFRSSVPAPDQVAATRIYKSVTTSRHSSRLQLRTLRNRWGLGFALTVALAVAAAAGASALAYELFAPRAPGFGSGFSAATQLPPAPRPADLPVDALARAAATIGISPDDAASRLRILRSGLSLGPEGTENGGTLYGLLGADGTACFFLTGQGGSCLTSSNMKPDAPDVLADVITGYPGQTPALVGIVADDVRTVAARIGDQPPQTLDIVNNSIYFELPQLAPTDRIALLVSYQDGSQATDQLR